MILTLLAVLSIQDAGPLPAARAPVPKNADAAIDCADAMTTYDMNVCTGRDLGRETVRMENYLKAARTRAEAIDADSGADRTHQAAFLQNSQAAWEAYSAIACDGVYDEWKGGTIRTVMVLGCRIRLTRERTHFIWQNYLTYIDSTPAILPEPVDQATDALTARE